jgi:endoglucanase
MGSKKEGGARVMIAAHLDEIGLIVSHIDRQGFLRVSSLGVPFPAYMGAGRVQFEDGRIGVLGFEGNSRTQMPSLDKFYVDMTGYPPEERPQIGDPAIFWRPYEEQGQHLIAKSMDDRIGCAIAIKTMQRLKNSDSPNELYFVFTVQEEEGTRGAIPSAYGVAPQVAFALDVTATGDTPKPARQMMVELGKGAAIKVADAKHITPPALKKLLIQTAQAEGIPYQLEVLTGGTTDASVIQQTHHGVPSGAISIPCRYVHSPSEVVHYGDVLACTDLLTAVLKHPLAAIRPG